LHCFRKKKDIEQFQLYESFAQTTSLVVGVELRLKDYRHSGK